MDSDDLSSLGTSDDSVLENEFLSLGFDEPSSHLHSSEGFSDLLATARLSLNDDLLGPLANSLSIVPNLVLFVDLNSLFGNLDSSDLVFVNLVSLKGGSPSLDALLGAWARLLVDDDLSGFLANTESVSVDDDLVVDSVGSDLEGDSVGSSSVDGKGVSPLFYLVESAWARLASDNDDLSGSGASGESVSDHSSVGVGLGDTDLSSPNSNLSLDLLARAWLVFHNNDSLAGLGADLGSLGPDCESLLSVLSSFDSDLSEVNVISSDLGLPGFDFVESAWARLVSDDDDLAGLRTSGDSAFKDVLLSNEVLSVNLDLESLDLSLLNSWAIGMRVLDSV